MVNGAKTDIRIPGTDSTGCIRAPQRCRPVRLAARLRRFHRDEDGSLVVFSVFLFLMMLFVGGLGVDFMRAEYERTRLQNTLDRAILAAADLDQTQTPAAVVNDYFAKSGLPGAVTNVVPVTTLGFRSVQATANRTIDTQLIHMLGVDTLSVPAAGMAVDSVEAIEISLVLDISGSMRFRQGSNPDSRMDLLKPAARNFVSSVLRNGTATTVSINLVPYAGQTNPGPEMFDYLNGVRYAQPMISDGDGGTMPFPNVSSCLEMANSEFSSTGLPASGAAQVPHFMMWDIEPTVMDWGWCPEDDTAIQYAQSNVTALHGFINNLRMHDGTGTHYAMKYGLALLDPTTQPAFAHLSANGKVPADFATRPFAWNAPDSIKYIVLMTDGQITEQVRPKNALHPENPTVELQPHSSRRKNITSASTNVNSFYATCNLAKANGVIVYTIAFQAPSSAQTQMRNCASSPSHFFNVQGNNISGAFNSIAANINALRLTQ